jgi:hypothetical protein
MNRSCLPFFALISLCCIVLDVAARADNGSDPADYAGVWVMKLGQRNLMVLTLKVEKGRLSGSLLRPEHLGMNNGLFSQISATTITEPVVRSSVQQGRLIFTVQKPADKKDEDEFEMTLASDGQAFLKIAGFPVDSWTISKVGGTSEVTLATDWQPNRSYMQDDSDTPSAAMKTIFDEDQRVRLTNEKIDWEVVNRTDEQRREATRKLLASGQLHTAKDFERAAFVFQHGSTPEDYLFAHTLAMVAVSKGDSIANWIAAATLDRYLQSIGKPQVYGTQFLNKSDHWTQDPYVRDLVSDALRRQLGVPSEATQQEQLKKYNTPEKASH